MLSLSPSGLIGDPLLFESSQAVSVVKIQNLFFLIFFIDNVWKRLPSSSRFAKELLTTTRIKTPRRSSRCLQRIVSLKICRSRLILPTWELRWATKTATIAMFAMSCGAICPSIFQPFGVQPNAYFALSQWGSSGARGRTRSGGSSRSCDWQEFDLK